MDEQEEEFSTNVFDILNFDTTEFENDDQIEFELTDNTSICYSLKIKRVILEWLDTNSEELKNEITGYNYERLLEMDSLQLFDVLVDRETLQFIGNEFKRREEEYDKNKAKE